MADQASDSTNNEQKQNLFALLKASNDLEQKILEAAGEITDEIDSMIQAQDLAIANKVDGYHFFMGRFEAQAELYANKARLLLDASSRMKNAQLAIKTRLKTIMQEHGKTEILGNEVRFKLVDSAPSMKVDVRELDESYKIQEIKMVPDKERIMADLKMNLPVKGAELQPVTALRVYAPRKEEK